MDWDEHLTDEAKALFNQMIPKYKERLRQIKDMPVSILIWGPSPGSHSPIGQLRKDLRRILRENGNLAMFSEELCIPGDIYSVRLQQLVQAEQYDLIISMPESPGSIGEIHDFAADRRVNGKILVFVNEEYSSGYSAHSLVSMSCIYGIHIIQYKAEDLSVVVRESLNNVNKIKEYKYMLSGRF
ncbi:MAG: hypothetical protein FWE91_11230 [Defluviitaleaceae bacterium]|nr:hypothetical protein [Defluviitaleaceae bacterium]